ncbi:MAG TPA: TldD/PmbA family protein [Candidatus Acidoferrales bacterium]|nr:TldD/PmbA family protein [Candidatus Acidoferrales bacterium]
MSARAAEPDALLSHAAHALERARAAGAQVADACLESSRAFTVSVLGGRVETLQQSGALGLGLRVVVGDAVGFCSGTDLSPAGIEELARRAVALARYATPDPANGAPTREEAGPESTAELELVDQAARELSVERKIELALALEAAALGTDPRIRRTDGASVSSSAGAFAIANSHGVARAWAGTSVSAWVNALAEDGARQQSGVYGMSKRHLADVADMESIGREAARRALSRLGARSVPAARVPVVMSPEIAASWIGEMYDAFRGEAVLKHASWLSEKLGQTIASPLVTLVDDGALVRGLGSSPYDAEGLATRRNVLIDAGRCAMFEYDHYHARRAGVPATANGVRGFASTPGTGCHNLFLAPGTWSPESIVAGIERGFYFDDQGSYGFNPVSGDYSYQAQGFWIERGEKVHAVEGVTVAGRSLEMLAAVAAVGNDLEWRTSVAAPTVLIAEMTVSG